MNNYYSKHRHFIFLWLILMIIVGVSGYFTYSNKTEIKDSQNTQNNPNQEVEKKKLITDPKKITPTQEKKNTSSQPDNYPTKIDNTTIEPTTTIPKITEVEKTPSSTKTTTNTLPFKLNINGKTAEYQTEPDTTVYKAMQNLLAENRFSFHATQYSGMGYFIDEIDHIKNDPKNGLYWIYYINGESANVGVSLYSLKPNDLITWKYEKSKF